MQLLKYEELLLLYILRRGLVLPHVHMLLQCPLYEPGFLAETPINYTINIKILFSTWFSVNTLALKHNKYHVSAKYHFAL